MRMLVGQSSANCNQDEVMVSAYCARTGGATGAAPAVSLQGMSGATCEGDGVAVVLACAKK
jgi:hypothetical protein